MRFMMLMIPGGYEAAEPDAVENLDPEAVEKMMKYNSALEEAGVLLDLNGLHPPSSGARVSFAGGEPRVTDGPFAEAKEVVGGYWIIDVSSKEEAVEWAKRCPGSENEVIEIRRIQEMSDFSDEVRTAAEEFPDLQRRADERKES
ncbi:MAG: YciI family protein [Longimicrobiales bacterium]